jgi:nitrogen fixation protein FixH
MTMLHSSTQRVQSNGRCGFAVAGAAIALAITIAIPLQAAAQTEASKKPAIGIMFTSKPSPPKTGDNTFEVILKDAAGKPITDADVTAMFYMAKMGPMPEMKNNVTLKHEKDGRYVGTGQVMMAGKWDVTVKVKRGGKEIASKKFPVTAQ